MANYSSVHIRFFDKLRVQLGYKRMEDWYNITYKDIQRNGGGGILTQYYKGSPSCALLSVFPEHKWELDKFKNKPAKLWKSNKAQRKLFLSNVNQSSGTAPKNFWKNTENHRTFFDWPFSQLGYKCMDDWYRVLIEDIHKHGGEGLPISYYKGSPSSALMSVYPNHHWELEKFKNKPLILKKNYGEQRRLFLRGITKEPKTTPFEFWKNKENQRKFFDWVRTQLGYKNMEDWYNVTIEGINKNGGSGLLTSYYKNSPSSALQSVYPEHDWMPWRFKSMATSYKTKLTKDTKEVTRVFEWLGKQLSIKSLEEWYRVSLSQIRQWVLVSNVNQLSTMLQTAYPQHKWDTQHLDRQGVNVKAAQREVMIAMQQIFPNRSNLCIFRGYELEEDYKHPKMFHSSGSPIELDVYIEGLKIAVEYQGEQHYRPMYWTPTDLETQQMRDEEKRSACTEHDITLIEVPYWWDRRTESLAATIHKARSDLISNPPEVKPIPKLCPIPLKEGTQAPLTHGYPWDGIQDITGWWMSEKMDGVRAYWNGEKLLSRYGNMFAPPQWFTSSLPNRITLDGELWMGKDTTHENVTKLVSSTSGDWGQLHYYLFDIPSHSGSYEARMKELETVKSLLPPHVHVVKNTMCLGTEHLYKYLETIVASNGEGVILRKPLSHYVPERTSSVLKVKKFEDTEVKVLAVLASGLYCQQ